LVWGCQGCPWTRWDDIGGCWYMTTIGIDSGFIGVG